jgi:hypothetical protein
LVREIYARPVLWAPAAGFEAILGDFRVARFEPSCRLTPLINREQGRLLMPKRYWLDYDPVAFAVLVIGIGMIELLALSI